jgi:hypothetical protein
MQEYKTWEEMTVLEQYACQYWDMFKDAHGVRPRGIDTSSWTEQDFEQEFACLAGIINKTYDQRHGGPFDRGSADSYYHREANPHYFKGDSYNSTRVSESEMTTEELDAYFAGYACNEESGHKKDWS